jgi:hypothetical protein
MGAMKNMNPHKIQKVNRKCNVTNQRLKMGEAQPSE